jgi:hypothetical protein
MSAIESGSSWDSEMYTDRVDVIREVGRTDAFSPWNRNPSGQAQPEPQIVMEDVPCKIQRMGREEDVQATADRVSQKVQVGFPFAVEISVGDLLRPKPPSVGPVIRVGSYDYDTTLEFGLAVGTQRT